jgi:hypothetical protein
MVSFRDLAAAPEPDEDNSWRQGSVHLVVPRTEDLPSRRVRRRSPAKPLCIAEYWQLDSLERGRGVLEHWRCFSNRGG